jgi:hypothetical protein
VDEFLFEHIDGFPEIITSPIEMTEANSSFRIFEGDFTLKNESIEISVTGQINFYWLPNLAVYFSGSPATGIDYLFNAGRNKISFYVLIGGIEIGKGSLVHLTYGGLNKEKYIKGKLSPPVVLGDKSIDVSSLRFSIPNLREFYGLDVKGINNEVTFSAPNRLIFEYGNYIIKIDKAYNYKELRESLDERGGFIILYGGELACKKGSLSYKGVKDTFDCLNVFLSFLNGRRTSAFFIHGIHDDHITWCDWSTYHVSTYKPVTSWPQKYSIVDLNKYVTDLNKLWQKFCELWNNKNDKNFLISVIHWYVEVNDIHDFTEGPIVMAQTALELLYNWWIVENKGIISTPDSDSLSAANKIRLILSQINIDRLVPATLTHLKEFNSKENLDAPGAVVEIRNAIVHSQEKKREKLNAITHKAKDEALQLCIWYIELALLRILNYDGKYYNRCSKERTAIEAEEYVPWTTKAN